MIRSHESADRSYYVSDERLAAYARLTLEERLRWVEELAAFLRLARASAPAIPPEAAPT